MLDLRKSLGHSCGAAVGSTSARECGVFDEDISMLGARATVLSMRRLVLNAVWSVGSGNFF